MNFIELVLSFENNLEVASDILTAELAEIGYNSFVNDEAVLKCYIEEEHYNEQVLDEVLEMYKIEFGIAVITNVIEQENWNAKWESDYQPVMVGNVIVRAPFHASDATFKYEIVIEPKMSFGTGHHETTSLMIQQVLDMDAEGKTILDMGCGTGVLAILAAMKGAGKVDAVDIDEWSYENSIENAEKNNVSNVMNVIQGGAESIPNVQYDVIFANINKNILLRDMSAYCDHLTKNGVIIFSGIYNYDLGDLKIEAEKYGLNYRSHTEKKEWVSVVFVNSAR